VNPTSVETSILGSLLDTNVLSEHARSTPNVGVIDRLRGMDVNSIYLSVVTLAEIRFGIQRLPFGVRRDALDRWLGSNVPNEFYDRILPVTDLIADVSGRVRAGAMNAGRPMGIADALIAATAEIHGLTLVTRNVKDFEVWGGSVFNPWSDA